MKPQRIIPVLIIFLFVYTAIGKLFTLHKNEAVLSHLPFIGNYSTVIAWFIPLAELFIVLLLLFQRTHATGLYASLFLLTGFTIYLAYMLYSGVSLPCTCGGVLEKMSWKQHVFFNLFFIALNLVALLELRKNKKTPPTKKYSCMKTGVAENL